MREMLKQFLILLCCSACVACAENTVKNDSLQQAEEATETIYLVSHGWHAGIVIKRAEIDPAIWQEADDFPSAEYLEVGWGDKDYYQTPDPDWGITLKAGLLPTDSVLHIVGFRGAVTRYFSASEVIEVGLSESGFKALCRYISASHQRDPAGKAERLGPGLYGNSRFYRSHETYHLFNNCNAWSARALKKAGKPITPSSIITVDQLMSGVRDFGKVIQSQPATPAPETDFLQH